MNYWVYETWKFKSRTTIHKSECGFCNNGTGIGYGFQGAKIGKWHGPFFSIEEAQQKSKYLGRPENNCAKCLK
jgi:hypothetical protein